MEHIKTIEQAQALPEVDLEFWEKTEQVIDNDGNTRLFYKMRKFSPIGIESDDDICLFTDKDGRRMKVISTEKGFAKVKFSL